jgi:hypothetical protein
LAVISPQQWRDDAMEVVVEELQKFQVFPVGIVPLRLLPNRSIILILLSWASSGGMLPCR